MADHERKHRHDSEHAQANSLEWLTDPFETPAERALFDPVDLLIHGMAHQSAKSAQVWHPPKAGEWTHNTAGHIGDPINLYVHGDLADIEAAFLAGGWSLALPMNKKNNTSYVENAAGEVVLSRPIGNAIHGISHLWSHLDHDHKDPHLRDPFKKGVDSMPVSDMVYKGKLEVASFEKGNNPTGGRHHFRIFDTLERDPEGRHVWAIAASQDIGIVADWNKPQTGFTTHVVDPDTDHERQLVLDVLRKYGHVRHLDLLSIKFGKRTDGTTSSGAYDVVDSKNK
jgi:hypothetical protein